MMGLSRYGTSRQESFPKLSAGKRDRSADWSFLLDANDSTPGPIGGGKGYGIQTRAKTLNQSRQSWRPLRGLLTASGFVHREGPISTVSICKQAKSFPTRLSS